MSGEYRSITDAFILVGWNYFFDWLTYRSLALQQVRPDELCRPSEMLI